MWHKRAFWSARRSRKPKRPTPCAICGMAAQTVNTGGYVCVFYRVHISRDEAQAPDGDVRSACLRDGNHFQFRLRGIGPDAMLEMHMRRTDWAETRTLAKTGAWVAALSFLVAVVALFLHGA